MHLHIYISKYQYSCPCWQENIYGNPKKIFKSGSIHHSAHISRAGSQRDRTTVHILEFSPCEESYHEYFWIAATSGPALATLGSANLWAMFEEIPTFHKEFFKDLCQSRHQKTSATEVGMLVVSTNKLLRPRQTWLTGLAASLAGSAGLCVNHFPIAQLGGKSGVNTDSELSGQFIRAI